MAPPAASTATQNASVAQDTAESGAVSIGVGADHVPVKARARPATSTATQNVVSAHETEVSSSVSMVLGVHVVPSKRTARPSMSTATQNVVEAHETEVSAEVSTLMGAAHLPAVSTATSPAVSATTHEPGAGHEIDDGCPPAGSIACAGLHATGGIVARPTAGRLRGGRHAHPAEHERAQDHERRERPPGHGARTVAHGTLAKHDAIAAADGVPYQL